MECLKQSLFVSVTFTLTFETKLFIIKDKYEIQGFRYMHYIIKYRFWKYFVILYVRLIRFVLWNYFPKQTQWVINTSKHLYGKNNP